MLECDTAWYQSFPLIQYISLLHRNLSVYISLYTFKGQRQRGIEERRGRRGEERREKGREMPALLSLFLSLTLSVTLGQFQLPGEQLNHHVLAISQSACIS
jgi:hypothetical protein